MIKQGKVWGWTSTIYSDHNIELNLIYAKKGGYCSLHRHISKYNLFFVFVGQLKIEVEKSDYDLTDVTNIKSFQQTIVPPGELHRFRAVKDTYALELYWVKLDLSDIRREDVGGSTKEITEQDRKDLQRKYDSGD